MSNRCKFCNRVSYEDSHYCGICGQRFSDTNDWKVYDKSKMTLVDITTIGEGYPANDSNIHELKKNVERLKYELSDRNLKYKAEQSRLKKDEQKLNEDIIMLEKNWILRMKDIFMRLEEEYGDTCFIPVCMLVFLDFIMIIGIIVS